jgi:hypothetical protein
MLVIEALFIGVEEPHDYLHIKHVRECRRRFRPVKSKRITGTADLINTS